MIEIRNYEGAVLTTVDAHTLEGADLSGRNLTHARLPGAHLRRANLRGATLSRADLRGAVLCDIDLSSADLVFARLDGANLERANLTRVKADHAMFVRARLVEADLTGGSFVRANFDEAGYSHLTTPTLPNLRDTVGYARSLGKLASTRTTQLSLRDRLFASKERHLADAVGRCDLKRAEELLEKGARPDAPRQSDGTGTVLHAAILKRDDQMIDLLVRHGANLEARGDENFTPLQYAVQLGNGPAVLALLRAGADRTIISGGGRNLMELAMHYEQRGLVELFARLDGLVRIDLGP